MSCRSCPVSAASSGGLTSRRPVAGPRRRGGDRYPGIAAHLRACGLRGEDIETREQRPATRRTDRNPYAAAPAASERGLFRRQDVRPGCPRTPTNRGNKRRRRRRRPDPARPEERAADEVRVTSAKADGRPRPGCQPRSTAGPATGQGRGADPRPGGGRGHSRARVRVNRCFPCGRARLYQRQHEGNQYDRGV